MARGAAFALLLAALALRLLVPAGFMPVFGAHGARIVPCSGHGPMAMAMPGGHRHAPAGGDPHDEGACGFSALGEAAVGGGAPVALPAIAIASRVARARRETVFPIVAPRHLRPPLRGPPARSVRLSRAFTKPRLG